MIKETNKEICIRRTDDEDHAKRILNALRENDGYCPCSVIRNEDTKCMCKEFDEQESGSCRCGLYIKDTFGV